jgi:hypothetical protein
LQELLQRDAGVFTSWTPTALLWLARRAGLSGDVIDLRTYAHAV